METVFAALDHNMLILVIGVISAFCLEATVADKSIYMKRIGSSTEFNAFIDAGNGVKVVYFYGKDVSGRQNFLIEMEKSAAIMQLYDTEFALVDCAVDNLIGSCNSADSESRVYMYRLGRMLLDVPMNSMFDLDSIISNVLQIVLLYDAPILQSVAEREKFEMDNKGRNDVVFSYQRALGTYAHRILMEIVFAYRSQYRFAVTNERETVKHLPEYSESESCGVWLLRCQQVTDQTVQCPAVKYTGPMDRDSLAQYFHTLSLPHIQTADGLNSNVFDENHLHTVYIHHDKDTQVAAKNIASKIVNAFFPRLGVLLVDIDVTVDQLKLPATKTLPTVSLQLHGQTVTHYTDAAGDDVMRFIAQHLRSQVTAAESAADTPTNTASVSSSGMNLMTSQPTLQQPEADKEDDEVAAAASLLRKSDNTSNAVKTLVHLTSKTFHSATVHRSSPLMVLFYVLFDGRSEVALSLWHSAAMDLQSTDTMAAVNCYDWTDVCQQANITSYPTIRIYRTNDQPHVHYSGFLSKSALVNTANMWKMDAVLQMENEAELEQFASEKEPRDLEAVVRVFGGFEAMDDPVVSVYNGAASSLQGQVLFSIATGHLAHTGCMRYSSKPPCVVVIRTNDAIRPFTVLAPLAVSKSPPEGDSSTVNSLIEAINKVKLLTLPELTPHNFACYFALRRPFVIAFINTDQLGIHGDASNHGNLMSVLTMLAAEDTKADVVYGWMNVSQSNEVASRILRHHVENPGPEELLVIDNAKGSVHRLDQSETTIAVEPVRDWLAAILAGGVATSHMLSGEEWSPSVGAVDFLALMDAEELAGPDNHQIDEFMKQINDDGLGVDDLVMSSDDDKAGQQTSGTEAGDAIEKAVEMELKLLEKSRLYTAAQIQQREGVGRMRSKMLHTEL